MSKTYDPIQTTTLTTTATEVNFTSISGAFTDLILVCNTVASQSATATLRLNADTGTNYSFTQMFGNGSSASSSRSFDVTSISIGYPITSFGTTIIQLQNYANTTTNKTVLSRDSNASNFVAAIVGLWRNTGAITSVRLNISVGTFNAGSTFTLYGIRAE